jgi:hypothetical protein
MNGKDSSKPPILTAPSPRVRIFDPAPAPPPPSASGAVIVDDVSPVHWLLAPALVGLAAAIAGAVSQHGSCRSAPTRARYSWSGPR